MTRKGHYTDGRRWSHISNAWILLSSWNDREELATMTAAAESVRLENVRLRALIEQQAAEISELRAKQRAYEQCLVLSGPTRLLAIRDASSPVVMPTPESLANILDKVEQQAKEVARLLEDLDCAERALILLRAERTKEHP